jgi:hypothetical protein
MAGGSRRVSPHAIARVTMLKLPFCRSLRPAYLAPMHRVDSIERLTFLLFVLSEREPGARRDACLQRAER